MNTNIFKALMAIQKNIMDEKYELDHKGHYSSYYDFLSLPYFFIKGLSNQIARDDLPDTDFYILNKIANCEELEHFYQFNSNINYECWHCGEQLTLTSNGKIFTFNHSCNKKPSQYSITIKTPSKKIIIANDLRDFYYVKDKKNYNVSQFAGVIKESEYYQSANLGLISTGNKLLHIDKKDDTIFIQECEIDNCDVFTDLWAVCIADYEEFISLFTKKYSIEEIENIIGKFKVLDVTNNQTVITSFVYDSLKTENLISIT